MSLLATVTTGKRILPPRVMVYGTHGVGKTTFLSQTDRPIVIQTEEGTDTVGTPRFALATDIKTVLDQLSALANESHEYGTVGIDTVDWLEPLIWKQVAKEHGKTSIEEIPYGKGFTFALDLWRQVLDGLTILRNDRGMVVVLLAHCEIKRFDNPETDPYDRYQPRLHAKASAMLQEWADAVLFANYKTFTKSKDVGFRQEVTRAIGTGERVLFTTERPSHLAKNHYSLPEEIPLSWKSFANAVLATA